MTCRSSLALAGRRCAAASSLALRPSASAYARFTTPPLRRRLRSLAVPSVLASHPIWQDRRASNPRPPVLETGGCPWRSGLRPPLTLASLRRRFVGGSVPLAV